MPGSPISPITGLRSRYERARTLDLDEQIRDCGDYLQNPEILAAELVDAYLTVDLAYSPPVPGEAATAEPSAPAGAFLPPLRKLTIVDPLLEEEIFQVTCVASTFVPLAPLRSGSESVVECGGLDYLGLASCDPPAAVLGMVQSTDDSTPYVMLLRLLSCLSELAPPKQLEYLDEQLFEGVLGAMPLFDLHLILDPASQRPPAVALAQLTQDLSEAVLRELGLQDEFPKVVRGILCASVDTDLAAATANYEWRVGDASLSGS